MIRAIIFDCFGVLTTDTWNAFLDTLPSDTDISAAREVHRAYNAGLIDKTTCNRQIRDITGHTFAELEDTAGTQVTKNIVLLDYIATLKPTYKIGMLSNIGSNWVRDTFLTDQEQGLFDEMLFSYEIGVNKPDPQAFKMAAERLGVQADEAVMVDDQRFYVEAAKNVGMQAVVYSDFQQFRTELEQILRHT